MARHVAFLRGINLGGRRVTNERLCAAVAGITEGQPHAFLASGNLILDLGDAVEKETQAAGRIQTALATAFGFEVPTIVRSADYVLALAASEPFTPEKLAERGKPQIILFSEPASDAAIAAVDLVATADDQLRWGDRVLHWLPRAGVADSALDMRTIERELVLVTTRTRNTIDRIAKKFL